METRQCRANAWVPRYLRTVGETPLLDRARERALAMRMRSGRDAGARDELILANLKFAYSFCRRFQGMGLSMEDLVAEAHVGLIEAADRFDPERKVRFISYAVFWIRRAINRALTRQVSCMPLPPRQLARVRAVRQTRHALRERLGREPDAVELGDALGIGGDAVRARLRAIPRVVSLEELLTLRDAPSASGLSRGDLIGERAGGDPESCLQRTERRALVRTGLRELIARERFVLECRYGLTDGNPMTLSEVSRRIGVSREMVRLIELRAREKMLRRIRTRHRRPARPVRRSSAVTARSHRPGDGDPRSRQSPPPQ